MVWGGVRRVAERMPLRVRLVLALVGILAGTLVLVAVATTSALERYLLETVDKQLDAMLDRVRPQIAQGAVEFRIYPPSATGGLRDPDQYVTEALDTGNQSFYSDPAQLPADAPDLRHADLSRVDPFTVP